MEKKKRKNKKIIGIQKIFDFGYFFFDFVKITGCIPILFWMRIKRHWVHKKKPKGLHGSYIIACNHVSQLDFLPILIAFWNRRISFFMAKEVFETNQFVNLIFRWTKMIYVDRENPSLETFKQAKRATDYGHTVAIFPEGHVLLKGENEFDNFKLGAAMTAAYCGVDIVPCYVTDRDHWYQRNHIMIGEPIHIKEYVHGPFATMDEINNLNNELIEKEKELSKKMKDIREKKRNEN